MSDVRAPVYAALSALGIEYEVFEHPPVFTAEEAALHWSAIPGARIKNLFLRNKKGDRHYLVILGIEKQADLRQLVKLIGDDRLSFGSPERLNKYLGVTPGSVSPLGLIHDAAHTVRVIVDSDLKQADRLIFHPNDNTASLTISGGSSSGRGIA
jgi:Ala-tRNA(Pro) deacylase